MDARRIPFTEEDERRIASAATWGIIVSITSIATAALSLLVQGKTISQLPALMELAGPAAALPIGQAVITVLINVWLLQASLSFRKVALTDEADQAHLLAGFRRLRGYFMVQVILFLAAFGVGIFAAIMVAS